jgi:hypothetical protein
VNPRVIQNLPDYLSGITTNQEAIRNQLALAAEFIPGLKNRLGESLTRMQQMSFSVSNPSVGVIIFLLVTLCLTLISFFRPDLFPRDITHNQ